MAPPRRRGRLAPLLLRLFATLALGPALAAAGFATLPAWRVAKGLWFYEPIPLSAETLADPAAALALKRHLQKYWLDHNIYVPLEDVVIISEQEKSAVDLALLMQKSCGQGRLFVWIPVRFRLPFVGDKVIEWCWKPKAINV